MTRPRRLAAALSMSLLVAGCGGAPAASSSPVSNTPEPPASNTPEPIESLPAPSAAVVPSSVPASGYASKEFGVPLTVTVPTSMPEAPVTDATNLLTWTSSRDDDNRVRFLIPVEVYLPGTDKPVSPPDDFGTYLEGLTEHGAVFSDPADIVVDGMEATLVTATTPVPLNGALGCAVKGDQLVHDCYGLQPDLALRIGVLDVDGTPLLMWGRTSAASPDADFLNEFEKMLASIDFTPSGAGVPGSPHAIVGEWVGVHDCTRIVGMLHDAGLDTYVGEQIYGNGLLPGVSSETGFNPADPCAGTVTRAHSHFFTADGRFGSKDFNGAEVDSGTYDIRGDTVLLNGDTPFGFEIEGDELRLTPPAVDTSACTTDECRFGAAWVLMVAMPGTSWTRGTVSP